MVTGAEKSNLLKITILARGPPMTAGMRRANV